MSEIKTFRLENIVLETIGHPTVKPLNEQGFGYGFCLWSPEPEGHAKVFDLLAFVAHILTIFGKLIRQLLS